jgi:hypothetical protein
MSLVVRRSLPRQKEAECPLLIFQKFKVRFNGTRGTLHAA